MSDVVEPSLDTFPARRTEIFDEQEYVEWVKRQLGYPILDVELDPENIKDGLKEALALYSKFKARKATESFTAADGMTVHPITTPGVRGVYKVDFQGVTDGLNAPNIEAQLMSGSFAYYGVAAPKMDLRYYEYARQWVKLASRELSSEQDYHLSDDGRTVYIYSPGRMTKVTLTLTLDHVSPRTVPTHDQYWIRRYMLAYSKGILGRIRSKFSTIPGANKDLTLDGPALLEESKTEMETLMKEIERNRIGLVPSWGIILLPFILYATTFLS